VRFHFEADLVLFIHSLLLVFVALLCTRSTDISAVVHWHPLSQSLYRGLILGSRAGKIVKGELPEGNIKRQAETFLEVF
jgi:hypothetical protein